MPTSTTDLSAATRELHVRSVVDQVYCRVAFLEELERRGQITYKGGKYIDRLVDTDEIDDQGQDYTENEPLTDAKKDTLEKPLFYFKKSQMPLRYGVDEELQNIEAMSEIQLLDLAKNLVKKGQKGVRIRLQKQLFNEGSATPVTDSGKKFLSLISALNHDTAYGGLTRTLSSNTNDWWQGSDPAGLNDVITSSSQDTGYVLTKNNLRKWINESTITDTMESDDDLYIMMCPSLWDKLAAEMESSIEGYKASDHQRQGIKKMNFDGHQIVSVPYLQKSTTMQKWVFILNMQHWELRVHSSRKFKLTDFKWQGDQINGYDCYLARILYAGNFVCWKPSSSMWLSNVT
jgi:hypothetical protein